MYLYILVPIFRSYELRVPAAIWVGTALDMTQVVDSLDLRRRTAWNHLSWAARHLKVIARAQTRPVRLA